MIKRNKPIIKRNTPVIKRNMPQSESSIKRGSNLDEGVKKSREIQFGNEINDPAALNNKRAFHYRLRLPLDKHVELKKLYGKLLNHVFIKSRKRGLLALEIIIANLIMRSNKTFIAVSMNYNDYIKTRYFNIPRKIIKLIHALKELDLIKFKKGIHFPNLKRKTRIRPKPELLKIFRPRLEVPIMAEPVELVELRAKFKRDKKGNIKIDEKGYREEYAINKKLIDYKDTNKTAKMRILLKKLNRVNKKAQIKYFDRDEYINDWVDISPYTKAVFTEKFTWHGRLYSTGYYRIQKFSKEERLKIKINGNPVVELDYSGLHPRLLYAKEKRQFDKDPYDIVHKDKRVSPFLKIMLLAMINCREKSSVRKACDYWRYNNYETHRLLKDIGVETDILIDGFLDAHKPISKYLCNGENYEGLKLMRTDSGIAMNVCKHFFNKGKPILPIHDSFIVEEQYSKELKKIMDLEYRRKTRKFDPNRPNGFRCKISQN